MGIYVKSGRTNGLAFIDPKAAATKVVNAYFEAVAKYGDRMRERYVTDIRAAAASKEIVGEMKQKLANYYAALAGYTDDLSESMQPAHERQLIARREALKVVARV